MTIRLLSYGEAFMFRIFVIAVVAFAVSAAVTYAVVLFGTLAAWHVFGVVDRDGGGAMALAFVIAPLIALIGGGAGAIAAGVITHQRSGLTRAGAAERRRDATRLELAAGAVAGGFSGYLLARLAFWLVEPIRYDAMWKAMAHAWAPALIIIAGAIAGGLFTRRLLRS